MTLPQPGPRNLTATKRFRLRIQRLGVAGLMVMAAGFGSVGAAGSALAAEGTYGAGNSVGINSQASSAYQGPDIRLNNPSSYVIGSDLVWVNGAIRTLDDGVGPMLSIGGTLHGQTGPARDGSIAGWDSIEVVSLTGSATTAIGNGLGDGTAVLRYTTTQGGLIYTMERTVEFDAPSPFVTDSYRFTIPDGNTAPVRFYYGGNYDTSLSDPAVDTGQWQAASPRALSLVAPNGDWQTLREVPGSRPFDGAVVADGTAAYSLMRSGAALGFDVADSEDPHLYVQWDLGTEPGTQEAALTSAGDQVGNALRARVDTDAVEVGQTFHLTVLLTSGPQASSGNDIALQFPAGISIGSEPVVGDCGGQVATDAPDTLTLTDAHLGAFDSCEVTIPLTATAAGDHAITPAIVTGISGLQNYFLWKTVTATATAPSWSDTTLPAMTVGEPVDHQLTASGVPAPTYAVIAGALPAGLTLSAAGRITGTPTAGGPAGFTVEASNSAGSAPQPFTVPVAKAPTQVTLPASVTATAGSQAQVTVTGLPTAATGTVQISITMPPGLRAPGLALSPALARVPVPGEVLCSFDVQIASGCQLPTDLDPGSYPITAVYVGDENYAASWDTATLSITAAQTTSTSVPSSTSSSDTPPTTGTSATTDSTTSSSTSSSTASSTPETSPTSSTGSLLPTGTSTLLPTITSTSGQLAQTGSSPAAPLWTSALLLASGSLLLAGTRLLRRRAGSHR